MKQVFKQICQQNTGLLDSNGVMIKDGDMVSLSGNLTADNSLGVLPNGWGFGKDDIYQVRYSTVINEWVLDLGCQPDTPYNIKYMNHAVGLLHDESVVLKGG